MRKVVMIPNGMELPAPNEDRLAARARLAIRPNEFAILLVGRMEYQKNHILALRAFSALLRQTKEKALLLFVGAGENEEMLRGLARALNIAERVRFLGYRNDVPSLLPAADLLLMTSWFEGMPLAALEAMTAGSRWSLRRGSVPATCSTTAATVFSRPTSSRSTSRRRSNCPHRAADDSPQRSRSGRTARPRCLSMSTGWSTRTGRLYLQLSGIAS